MASLRDFGYEEIRNIGRGQYGVVQLVRSLQDQMLYVCKTVDLTCRPKAEREAAQQEVGLLKSLNHPNIVQYKESFAKGDAIIIAMQYCEDGDLAGFIKDMAKRRMRVKETIVMSYLVQVLNALQYLHGKRILHRDLKSSNLFLTESCATVKLGDFGISKVLNTTMQAAMSVVGTPHYMSPEVCENRPYNQKSDVWSLGCVVYELCMLKHAFAAANLLGLVHKIVREKYEPLPPMYSTGLSTLVQRMLAKGPNARPSVHSILEDKHVQAFLRSQARNKRDFSPSRPARGSGDEMQADQGVLAESVGVPMTDQLLATIESSQEVSTMDNVTTNANELGSASRPEHPEPAMAWTSPGMSPHMDTAAALLEDSEEYDENDEYEDDFCSEDLDSELEETVEDDEAPGKDEGAAADAAKGAGTGTETASSLPQQVTSEAASEQFFAADVNSRRDVGISVIEGMTAKLRLCRA